MRILIIETRHCHSEIFPTWTKLLEEHQLIFWQSRKSAKLNILPFLSEFTTPQHITSSFSPLSREAHISKIKQLAPNLIILNSAEVNTKSKYDATTLQAITDIPVLALCHRRDTYESLLTINNPRLTACTLSPKLSSQDNSIAAVHYTRVSVPPPPISEGLKLIVPGSVAWDRRHYPFISAIDKALSAEDSITILGSCPSRFKKELSLLLNSTERVRHVSNAKPFPPFIKAIQQSHAILPLIEPQMSRFQEYTASLLSGSVNLAIGLQRPMLAHAEFLASQPNLTNLSQPYTESTLRDSIEDLKQNSTLLSSKLADHQSAVLDDSKNTISKMIQKICASAS